MRRFWIVLLAMLLVAASAGAEALGQATDALFDAVMAMDTGRKTDDVSFAQQGAWMSAIVRQSDADWRTWQGFVWDTEAGAMVAWEDLFVDGDAAAARLEEIAAGDAHTNAYAEHTEVAPMPRGNFSVADGALTVYYPPEQLSYFSGRAGAYSFLAYELEGLLKDGTPLAVGDVAGARGTLEDALAAGALPGALARWAVGGAMSEAAESLDLLDVPDLARDYAVWRFEAPEMRGVTLLSVVGDEAEATARIAGVQANRIDFGGLCTGVATREACVAALGEPMRIATVESADAYDRLPVGETLVWSGHGRTVGLHFVDGVLFSVILVDGM